MSESFADVLSELGFTSGFISICHQKKGEPFNSTVTTVENAPASVAAVEGAADVWFGVNPVEGPERALAGRGTANDVTQLLVLPIDLDVKEGGMPDLESAEAVISDISAMLNCPPVAVTFSGHGLQPLWSVEDGHLRDGGEFSRGDARALLRRWGRLCAAVAERRGGRVDSIFDLARVLRVPGTTNRKAEPVAVRTEFRGGYPLETSQVLEVLAAYGIPEYEGDSSDFGGVVSVPQEWKFSPVTFPYVKSMVKEFETDPVPARHSWLTKVCVRLAAAWRTGRISEEDFRAAQNAVVARMVVLCEQGNPPRKVNPGEIAGAWQWALGRVSSMSDTAAYSEVGGEHVKTPRELSPVAPTGVPALAGGDAGLAFIDGDENRFFDKETGPLVIDIARAVLKLGPLRWGADEAFWTWNNSGVWRSSPREVQTRCVRLLKNRFRKSISDNVETVVRSMVPEIECGPVEGFINFTNGMLNWRTGEMVPHAEEFKSTVQLPIPYDPEAKCPHFDEFLESVLTDDYVRVAWQMMGYLMFSGNPLQVAFLFLGTGGNGKGTLMRIISAMLGQENCSAESLDALNTNKFAAISLFGKIANLAGDIDATYQQSTANFKKLTGEDLYAAERKFGARFLFTSWAVPVFSANKIPPSADTSRGYLRRWVVLTFGKTITKPILGLSDRLLTELPGIAARAVAEIEPLMKSQKFDITGEALQGQDEFATSLDQVRQWIDECCIPAPEHKATETRDSTYAAYRAWATRNGNGIFKGSEFYHRMESAGYPTVKRNSGRRYIDGLKIMEGRQHAQSSTPDAFDEITNALSD